MIPSSAVIPRPSGGIALGSGETSASQHKGPQVGLESQHSFIGGVRVLHAEHVVDFAMIRRPTFDAMNHIKRHGLRRISEHSRFIHVVPEAANPHFQEVRVQGPPPLAYLFPREIRKDAVAGPHLTYVHRSIGILHKMTALEAFIVRSIAGESRDMKIRNGDHLESLCPQVLHHSFEIRKALTIHRERAVVLLVVDIEVDDRRRESCACGIQLRFPEPATPDNSCNGTADIPVQRAEAAGCNRLGA